MPGSVLGQVLSCLAQPDPAAPAAVDAVQHLADAGPFGQPSQLTREVLLQRLAPQLGPALKSCVNVIGDVPDKYIRHAYIMLSRAAPRKLAAPQWTASASGCRRLR
jgi:hypothetical protein